MNKKWRNLRNGQASGSVGASVPEKPSKRRALSDARCGVWMDRFQPAGTGHGSIAESQTEIGPGQLSSSSVIDSWTMVVLFYPRQLQLDEKDERVESDRREMRSSPSSGSGPIPCTYIQYFINLQYGLFSISGNTRLMGTAMSYLRLPENLRVL